MTYLLAALVTLAYLVGMFKLATLVGRLIEYGTRPCECAKGRICAACLAESEAIRPKPETTKEAAA